MRILFLPGTYNSPSSRFRLWQFVEPIRNVGHEVEVRVTRPERTWGSAIKNSQLNKFHTRLGAATRVLSALWILRDASKFDVIVMNRDVVPETSINFLELWLSKRNPRLIFDFDDAIHLGKRQEKLEKVLPHFAWITPGNEYLAEFARKLNPNVSIWPTVVNTNVYSVSPHRHPGPIRIGWSGSNSTLEYCLPLLRDVICDLAQTNDFEFIVIANVRPQLDWPGVNWRYIPWTPGTEVSGLQEIDVGLMPLRDEPFERGKCGLKAIQYMAVGAPAIVSPVGVNKEIVVPGETGYHATTKAEWIGTIKTLLSDGNLRKSMGAAARQRAEHHYSIKSLLPQMINVFERVAGSRQ